MLGRAPGWRRRQVCPASANFSARDQHSMSLQMDEMLFASMSLEAKELHVHNVQLRQRRSIAAAPRQGGVTPSQT